MNQVFYVDQLEGHIVQNKLYAYLSVTQIVSFTLTLYLFTIQYWKTSREVSTQFYLKSINELIRNRRIYRTLLVLGIFFNSVPAYLSTALLLNRGTSPLIESIFILGYIGLAFTVGLFADGVRRMYLILKVVRGLRRSETYVFILFTFYVIAVSILFANILIDYKIMNDPINVNP